ncbi:hypothetical protein FJY69_09645 [candidate division WOR-3 bacterium]|nr:hypothetical protein [candidate division WOR-3 bacterium]
MVGAATGQTLHRYALSSPRYPAWDSVGDKVYWVGCYAAEVVGSFSGDGSRKLAEIPLGARPRAAWLDPLGRRFYVAADKADGIAVVDCASDSIVAVLPTIARENHRVLAGSPEKHRLYCANKTSLSIYETPTGRVIKKLELGAGPVALHCDPVTGRMFCALGDSTIVVIDPDGDTVVARFALPMRARVLGSIRASNFVYWVGDSAVGGIDPVALKATGVLRLPALWPFAAGDDDKGRIYVVGLDAVYVIHNRDPEYFLRSRTGPVFIARDAMLYGAQNATLFDITGRAVQTLRPGPNRLVGLVPGTYFLRRNGEAETRKVIITR